MYKFPISAMLWCFKQEFDESLDTAKRIGLDAVQLYCTEGELAPENLSQAKRKEIMQKFHDRGLKVSAVCGDLGKGFGNSELNPALVEKSKRILDLALDFETPIVTTHIGVVPTDKNHPRYKIMQDACFELSEYADSLNAHFAVETGPETSLTLKSFLDSLNSKGVGVNLDPANLVMVTGDDPVQAVYNLKDYIVHTHAKDGIKLNDGNPEYIYQATHPIPEDFFDKEYFREVPLGQGGVPFDAYLNALEDIGFKGYLAIERECGGTPVDDITLAYKFLRSLEDK